MITELSLYLTDSLQKTEKVEITDKNKLIDLFSWLAKRNHTIY